MTDISKIGRNSSGAIDGSFLSEEQLKLSVLNKDVVLWFSRGLSAFSFSLDSDNAAQIYGSLQNCPLTTASSAVLISSAQPIKPKHAARKEKSGPYSFLSGWINLCQHALGSNQVAAVAQISA